MIVQLISFFGSIVFLTIFVSVIGIGIVEDKRKKTSSDEPDKKNGGWGVFGISTLGVVGLWLLTFWGVPYFVSGATIERGGDIGLTVGSFGDMFGATTSLFSGLAFAGLIATLLMQRQELSLQRNDLELQLEEPKLNRGELASQRGVFQIQQFENSFYKQLELFRDFVANSRFKLSELGCGKGPLDTYSGTKLLVVLSENICQIDGVVVIDGDGKYHSGKSSKESFEFYYDKGADNFLGPYYRLFNSVYRLIGNSDLTKKKKMEYAKIARATLGPAELKLIAFYGLSEKGMGRKKSIVRYQIIKYLKVQDAVKFPFILDGYENSTFDTRHKTLADAVKKSKES